MLRLRPQRLFAVALFGSLPVLNACSGGGGSVGAPVTTEFAASASSSALVTARTNSPEPTATSKPTPTPAPTPSPKATAIPTPKASASPTAAPVARATSLAALVATAATSSDAFVDSIGVDSHFNYGGTSYVTSFAAISTELEASGIRHLRDGEPNDPHAAALATLGTYGIKHSVFFPVTTTAAQITSTLATYAPYVDFVEPQNEYDAGKATNPNWATQLQQEQQLLWATIRTSNAYPGISILGPSFAHAGDAATVGPLDQYEDAGNLHNYLCTLNPGTTASTGIAGMTAAIRGATAYDPIWTTEVGYEDDTATSTCGLTDATIAKFVPRTFAERWMAGEPRTYIYQFADMAPGTGYNAMGLVTSSGVVKPQYTALASMISLLSDPGAPFTTTPLAYSLGGSTQNVQSLLLQKRDGTYDLMLWLEVPSTLTSGTPQSVSVTLPWAASSAASYSYASNWTLQKATLPASNVLTVNVTDSVTFLTFHQ
jgi:hypothetical protein